VKYHVPGKRIAVGFLQTVKFKRFSKFPVVSSADFVSTLRTAIAPGLVGVNDLTVISCFTVTAKTSVDDYTVFQAYDEEAVCAGSQGKICKENKLIVVVRREFLVYGVHVSHRCFFGMLT
jgi:hypothetical protein